MWRRAALAVGVLLTVSLVGGLADSMAVSKSKAKKTHGIVSPKAGKNVAVKKPGKATVKTTSYFLDARNIGKWKGWGSNEVSAPSSKVTICNLVNGKKKNCSNAKGTLTFDLLEGRRCKGKKVYLYGATYFQHKKTGKYPDGRGVSIQYGYPGTAAECPKF